METSRPLAPKSSRSDAVITVISRLTAGAAVVLVVAILVFDFGAVVHGHPAYWVVLGLTLALAVVVFVRSFRARRPVSTRRRALRCVGIGLAILGLGLVVWLAPAGATADAQTALVSSDGVTVTETATDITLTPSGDSGTEQTTASLPAILFQSGAKVDARAYVALLRPLAQAGHLVVIPKQPLGIGFLAVSALDSARSTYPDISWWIVGGHSLGGTVAAVEATSGATDDVVGLLLYASYPATNISDARLAVLSISGDKDGLSTPEKIRDSAALLPADTTFVVIPGANHAMFGDYGAQVGDGTATVDRASATSQISRVTLEWVTGLDAG